MKYKILLFDLDNTLSNDTINRMYAFEQVLAFRQEEITKEKEERFVRIDEQYWDERAAGKIQDPYVFQTLEEKATWNRSQRFLRYFGSNLSFEEAKKLNEIYMNSLGKKVEEIEGAKEIIAYLSKKGYTIYIISNGVKKSIPSKLEKLGIEKYVRDNLTSEEVGHMKPSKEFYQTMMKRWNLKNKEELLVIGDEIHKDIELGTQNGIDTCWFNPNQQEKEKYLPTYEIKKLEELKQIL